MDMQSACTDTGLMCVGVDNRQRGMCGAAWKLLPVMFIRIVFILTFSFCSVTGLVFFFFYDSDL